MNIHGFTKTTLLDYPGQVASCIFTGGCNFRCPFCHNGELVLNPNTFPRIEEDEIFEHLNKRKNVLYGVCITGGEPTLQPDLLRFMEKVKALELSVKLDTNGYNPSVISDALRNNLVDYIAMDIKAGRDNYAQATGVAGIDISVIEDSASIIMNSNIDYEFRTTAVRGIHDEHDFEDISKWLAGESHYFLQSYKANDAVIDQSCAAFAKDTLIDYLEILRTTIPNAELRGVD